MNDVLRFPRLVEGLVGLSSHAIEMHLALYRRYVDELNDLDASEEVYSHDQKDTRRQAFVRNAVLLHELYFGTLVAGGRPPSSSFGQQVALVFGSWASMLEKLKAAVMTFNGWGVLARDRDLGILRVFAIEGHDVGSVAGYDLLLAVDGWEHAYATDYGIAKEQYLDVILSQIDWEVVQLIQDSGSYRAVLDGSILPLPARRQTEKWSCGAASIGSVLALYGDDIPEFAIIEAAGSSSEKGTDWDGMKEGLAVFGLHSERIETAPESLIKEEIFQGRPIVLDVSLWGGLHWVVAHGVRGSDVLIMDPAEGRSSWYGSDALTAIRWNAQANVVRGGILIVEESKAEVQETHE